MTIDSSRRAAARAALHAGLLALVLMLLIVFPSTLFNNTLEANIDVVRTAECFAAGCRLARRMPVTSRSACSN